MRVFSVSDIHFDYDENAQWVESLSLVDYQDDILILAGDISHAIDRLKRCIAAFSKRFKKVLFVPGNHDIWVVRDECKDSFEKFESVCRSVEQEGASVDPYNYADLSIVPLFSWYDLSFGTPSSDLYDMWMDFKVCVWPEKMDLQRINNYFLNKNRNNLFIKNGTVITFSHFLPRIDVMPDYIPIKHQVVYPVLGSFTLDKQVRMLNSDIHVYGHSHVNHQVDIAGVRYINNAYGSPSESMHAGRGLLCIYEN